MFGANQQESPPLYYSKITCKRLSDGKLLFMCGDSRHPSAAFLHSFLSLSQALCQNLGDLHVTGPLKDMNFSVPEGGGVRVIYQVISVSWYPLQSKTPWFAHTDLTGSVVICAGGKNSPLRESKLTLTSSIWELKSLHAKSRRQPLLSNTF